ncbi:MULTISPECIES: hypothetical protein [Sporolactobacillus]|uniref:Uncharacterized protein n=1 Tax=Sporolactobacillus inulinus TaxID=2078 RepID=A0A4Y1Z7I7_9BACL|nr:MULTISPECIES: hypothetical protein [Sporolactobacillus]GAY74908.1 hypothetical protein NBRC111894_462 [Sporolactobacillus inulinus]GEB77700.1 hypothetical protein SIN01_20450 [Sporolactobacillus inulinus]
MNDDDKINVIFETEDNHDHDHEMVALVFLVKENTFCEDNYEFIDGYSQ